MKLKECKRQKARKNKARKIDKPGKCRVCQVDIPAVSERRKLWHYASALCHKHMNEKRRQDMKKIEWRVTRHGYQNDATREEVLAFLEDCVLQDGKCTICGNVGMKNNHRSLAYDHDHKTGRYRGAICNNCNGMLGHAKDSIETLQAAIDYLKAKEEVPGEGA